MIDGISKMTNGRIYFSSFFVLLALVLVSCTDYVDQIDEQIEDFEAKLSAASWAIDSAASRTPDVVRGTFTDFRDGQTYWTVKIGSQNWLSDNLNFKTDNSFCFKNSATNCDNYGRLYKWADAVGKPEKECGKGHLCSLPSEYIQGVCPEGWHLPTKEEFESLFEFVSSKSSVGKALKSKYGWNKDGGGDNLYYFTALPAGYREGIDYYSEGVETYFWSATEVLRGDYAYSMHLTYYEDDGRIGQGLKDNAYSVRCVENNEEKIYSSSSNVTLESSSSEVIEPHLSKANDPTSSSVKTSSSMKSVSSSSLAVDVAKGFWTDDRDGQEYDIVTIGSQTWMAENLNYKTDGSYCLYDLESFYCPIYGRLYTWSVAKSACPVGWHLPSMAEWDTLFTFVGGIATAGDMLKATTYANGVDAYGFAVLLAGSRGSYPDTDAYFWTSDTNVYFSERYNDYAYDVFMNVNNSFADFTFNPKRMAYSVRCIKNVALIVKSSSSVKNPSSSSIANSSGSVEIKSSSSVFVERGTMSDARDGREYETVTIGSQTWMAQNLNFTTEGSYCYGDSVSNCSKCGGLYTWYAAINACPSGWHLPSTEEFETLFDAIGSSSTAGVKLKSISGWMYDENGTDDFGFNGLPCGDRFIDGKYERSLISATFWTASEIDCDYALIKGMGVNGDGITKGTIDKRIAFSVRCLQDDSLYAKNSSLAERTYLCPVAKSSSSAKIKSSSSVFVERGTMTDARDGQEYETVTIGSQIWMAQNLNYKSDSSYCYNDSANYCVKYGRLYPWSVAKAVCPSDWRLPTNDDFKTLLAVIGGSSSGLLLKSSTGWNNSETGSDVFGFSVLPAGYRENDGRFNNEGDVAYFWIDSDCKKGETCLLYYISDIIDLNRSSSYDAFSVRCIQ